MEQWAARPAHRAARVLPAYYAALVGAVILVWGLDSVPAVRLPDSENLLLFAAFAQNFTRDSLLTLDPPMWTLTVEMSFYIVLPLIGLMARHFGRNRNRIMWAVVGLGGVGLVWDGLAHTLAWPLVLTKVLPAMLPFFAAGMLACLAPRPASRRGSSGLIAAGVAAVAGDVGLAALAPAVAAYLHDVPAAAGFAAIVVGCSGGHAPAVLRTSPLRGLGKVSYGLYLWHVPVLWWLPGHGLLPLDPIAALPVVLAPSLALATLSWRFLEAPALPWARSHDWTPVPAQPRPA